MYACICMFPCIVVLWAGYLPRATCTVQRILWGVSCLCYTVVKVIYFETRDARRGHGPCG